MDSSVSSLHPGQGMGGPPGAGVLLTVLTAEAGLLG